MCQRYGLSSNRWIFQAWAIVPGGTERLGHRLISVCESVRKPPLAVLLLLCGCYPTRNAWPGSSGRDVYHATFSSLQLSCCRELVCRLSQRVHYEPLLGGDKQCLRKNVETVRRVPDALISHPYRIERIGTQVSSGVGKP